MISEQLRTTLLSLKQISDRLKALITTSVTKSEATADKNAIITAIGNIPAPDLSSVSKESQTKDGNDTAISVAKDVRSELGTGSDTAAETGTLFAVLKWTKNKVKDIYNAITDSTNGLSAIKTSAASAATDAAAAKVAAQAITGYALQGSGNSTQTDIANAIGTPETGQPSTLFAAVNAGGGTAGIATRLQQIIDAHILGFNYDGLIFESGYTPDGVVDVINNSGKLVEIHDSTGHTIYKITSSAYPKLQVYDMPNASFASAEIFSSNVLREIIITNAPTLGNVPFYNCGALRYLDIQNSRPNYTHLFSNGSTIGAGSPNLIRVKFGARLTGSTTFYQIATNAYSNSSKELMTDEEIAAHPTWHNLDLFLYNIREHIVKNLPDRTGQQPYTLTLSQETRNVLDQETEDAFAAKGWSLAPNKSV